MALSMQGITATTREEKLEMIAMLEATDADTGYMHEGFLADDPSSLQESGSHGRTAYSRNWYTRQ